MHRNSFYNRIEEGLLPTLFAQVTDHMFGRGCRPVFVEVGANDGVNSSKTIDFVQHHEWSGLAVEPVPSTFEKLRENLAPYSRVLPVNKAITDRIGTLPFYQVIGKVEQAGNVRLPMTSSFNKEVILKQRDLFPDIDDYIEEISVEATTLTGLCDEFGLDRLDILITGAEGFDDLIVHTIDFSRFRPLMVNIEHIHIPPARLRELDTLLTREGYQRCIIWTNTAWFGGDILEDECIRRMIRTLPSFIPDYDPLYGNGYWLGHDA